MAAHEAKSDSSMQHAGRLGPAQISLGSSTWRVAVSGAVPPISREAGRLGGRQVVAG